MRVREIRELTSDEINTRVEAARKELIELRFAHASRKLESPAKLGNTRKRLSRLLTIQSEKAAKAK
jgi:large subunit ribosomal protein L29